MKHQVNKLFWKLSLIIILFSCSPKYDTVRREANKIHSPPGTVWLKENIFMDETEITNVAWREFVAWNKKNYGSNSNAYVLSKSDTLVWSKLLYYCEPYLNHYHNHPSYNNYPVVGITKQQAEAYCKWRTFVVNQKLFIEENKLKYFDIDTLIHFPILYIYRLPTKEEWEYAASAGLDNEKYPYGFEELNYKYKKHEINKINWNDTVHNKLDAYSHFNNVGFLPQNCKYGKPNKFGFYNLAGNIAEVMEEDSIAKGGSYRHHPDSSKINIDIPYIEPEAWLGFRCVCEKVGDAVIDAKDLLDFDYSPNRYWRVPPSSFIFKDKDSIQFVKTHNNYFTMRFDNYKSCKQLTDLIHIDSTEQIISYELIYSPKPPRNVYIEFTQNINLYGNEVSRIAVKEGSSGDLLLFANIKLKNDYLTITLPPIYILLKE